MKIRSTVFVSIVATSFLSVAALMFIQRITFEQGFIQYIEQAKIERLQPVINSLIEAYAINNSWSFVNDKMQRKVFRDKWIYSDTVPSHKKHNGILPRGVALLDNNQALVWGSRQLKTEKLIELTYQGRLIGYLALPSSAKFINHLDKQFAKSQHSVMLWVSLSIFVIAACCAWLLSKYLSQPIIKIAQLVKQVREGRYDEKVFYPRNNELGELASDFNALVDKLNNNRVARQQWIADISHELRTPITILLAEIECIEDGHAVLDANALLSLKSEVKGLNVLVNDLHQLTLADSGMMNYRFEHLAIDDEIHAAVSKYQERFNAKQLTLTWQRSSAMFVDGDSQRLAQVFTNILENSLRYTTPAGRVVIALKLAGDKIVITIENTAPPLPDEALGKLFDRLYRAEPSRNRKTGASGLGLAICKEIIKGHGGVINARHSDLGGLAIDIELPKSKEQ